METQIPTMMRDAAISFPMLGDLTLNFPAGFTFSLFGHEFTIYMYGIVMAAAFLAAVFYASKKAPKVGIKSDDVLLPRALGAAAGHRRLPHILCHQRVGSV